LILNTDGVEKHMPKTGTRHLIGRGKGYLNEAGAQYRFIIFLLIVLGVYTFLLKVFQKLAEIVQLPVFLPVALITLLFFIGIVGSLYSHKFVGPLRRIRTALEHIAEGDMNVSLRLRESDDPALKNLVSTITSLCEHSRASRTAVHETVQDLFRDIEALGEKIQHNADKAEVQSLIEAMRRKRDLIDKAVKTHGKT
jgi:methyl-accepting chemotaxis protein